MTEIMVVAEHREGEIREISLEMLTKAKEIADEINAKVSSVILGHGIDHLVEELASYGQDRVYYLRNEKLENYTIDGYKSALTSFLEDRKPVLTMIGHTAMGLDFAPALAVSLDTPLVTDCIDLKFTNGQLQVTRQVYGGKINVELNVQKHGSYIATIRPTVFKPPEKTGLKGEIEEVTLKIEGEFRTKFKGFIKPEIEDIDISQADVIVSVGRGIGERENIKIAEELAKVIGGVLAASRPVVDNGWLPKTRQVGQSGKTVKPKLYLALGISGATQHLMGMKDSELIVAVNKDPNAPIFDIADIGIVADLFEVVPVFIEQLRK